MGVLPFRLARQRLRRIRREQTSVMKVSSDMSMNRREPMAQRRRSAGMKLMKRTAGPNNGRPPPTPMFYSRDGGVVGARRNSKNNAIKRQAYGWRGEQ